MIGGVVYGHFSPEGLHAMVAGEPRVIRADTFVSCVGQESDARLAGPLAAVGVSFSAVGGARDASRLDAVRAIEEGTLAALAI